MTHVELSRSTHCSPECLTDPRQCHCEQQAVEANAARRAEKGPRPYHSGRHGVLDRRD